MNLRPAVTQQYVCMIKVGLRQLDQRIVDVESKETVQVDSKRAGNIRTWISFNAEFAFSSSNLSDVPV